MRACSTYYHQGSDLCEDLEPFFSKLGDEVICHSYELYQIVNDLFTVDLPITRGDV